MNPPEVSPLFASQRLTATARNKADALTYQFNGLYNNLLTFHLGDGREMSLVKTHLELACMYAKKALSSIKENQETTEPVVPAAFPTEPFTQEM